jgi:hypothetical protein
MRAGAEARRTKRRHEDCCDGCEVVKHTLPYFSSSSQVTVTGAFRYYAVSALFPFAIAEGVSCCKLVGCGWECGLLWLAGCYP